MPVISQRELRNNNGEIMRQVEAGESFTVTRRGVPVARVVPLETDTRPRCISPATRKPDFRNLRRVTIGVPSSVILDELRADRI